MEFCYGQIFTWSTNSCLSARDPWVQEKLGWVLLFVYIVHDYRVAATYSTWPNFSSIGSQNSHRILGYLLSCWEICNVHSYCVIEHLKVSLSYSGKNGSMFYWFYFLSFNGEDVSIFSCLLLYQSSIILVIIFPIPYAWFQFNILFVSGMIIQL
jgi:hypothetical protein